MLYAINNAKQLPGTVYVTKQAQEEATTQRAVAVVWNCLVTAVGQEVFSSMIAPEVSIPAEMAPCRSFHNDSLWLAISRVRNYLYEIGFEYAAYMDSA